MRVGMGYDVHKLVDGRDLILGGVKIPYEKGLLGHSDADVLLHAVMDALLGAAALGDIGKHFPDTDPAYKGASSIKLLEEVGKLIDEKLYVIGNIDATIIAQRPKMAPHIEQMRKNVAEALELSEGARLLDPPPGAGSPGYRGRRPDSCHSPGCQFQGKLGRLPLSGPRAPSQRSGISYRRNRDYRSSICGSP